MISPVYYRLTPAYQRVPVMLRSSCPKPPYIRKGHHILMVLLFLLCLLALAGAPLGMWSSYFERLTHFRFYWIGILAALGLWWGLQRSWRWLAGTLVLLAWSGWGLIP